MNEKRFEMRFDKNGLLENIDEVAHIFDELEYPVLCGTCIDSIAKHLEATLKRCKDVSGKIDYNSFYREFLARFRVEIERAYTKPCTNDY